MKKKSPEETELRECKACGKISCLKDFSPAVEDTQFGKGVGSNWTNSHHFYSFVCDVCMYRLLLDKTQEIQKKYSPIKK